jgi:hypothetical protein
LFADDLITHALVHHPCAPLFGATSLTGTLSGARGTIAKASDADPRFAADE